VIDDEADTPFDPAYLEELKAQGYELTRQRSDALLADRQLDEAVIAQEAPGQGHVHDLSDIRNGQRFAEQHGDNVRYDLSRECWLEWDGHRWAEAAQVAIEARAKVTAISNWDEAKDGNSTKQAAFAVRSQSAAGIHGMLKMGRSEPALGVAGEAWNKDIMLLNTPSGTVNLRTGKLSPSKQSDLITRMTAAPFDPEAQCPRWLRFLEEIFVYEDGRTDRDLVQYMQRLVGYALTGSTVEQKFAIFHNTGSNGKGVFVNVIQAIMGDYAGGTPADLLLAKRSGEPDHRALAYLYGKRAVFSNEVDAGRRLNEALVKNITGSDPITTHRLYENLWTFTPEFTLMLATNFLPEIRGTDVGVWRRVHRVPFNRTFKGNDIDENLEEKLRAEAPGILAWAVEGTLEWLMDGLAAPWAVTRATEEYRAENDIIRRFIEDCCDTSDRKAIEAAGAIYSGYKGWCESEGLKPVSGTAFGSELTKQGFSQDRQYINGKRTKIRRHICLMGPVGTGFPNSTHMRGVKGKLRETGPTGAHGDDSYSVVDTTTPPAAVSEPSDAPPLPAKQSTFKRTGWPDLVVEANLID
jgi:putative DNA primase/helicase